MTKNLVHRSLTTLVDEGILMRCAKSRRYELGPGVLWFSSAQNQNLDIKTLCMPYMQEIEKITGLTVSVQIPVGEYQIPVHGIDGRRSGLTKVVEGVPVPLHISSGSRAILAFLDESKIQDYIRENSPLKEMTRHTITDPEVLVADLEKIREQGFARGIEGHYLGVRAVAFPVLDRSGRPVASLTVVGSNASITEAELGDFCPKIKPIMDDLNHFVRLQTNELAMF